LIARGKEHKTVAEICKTAGVRVLGVPADISKTESVQEAAAAVKS
jgi:hypothetical protein